MREIIMVSHGLRTNPVIVVQSVIPKSSAMRSNRGRSDPSP